MRSEEEDYNKLGEERVGIDYRLHRRREYKGKKKSLDAENGTLTEVFLSSDLAGSLHKIFVCLVFQQTVAWSNGYDFSFTVNCEHLLDSEKVPGSIPGATTFLFFCCSTLPSLFLFFD
jgi:hypothetical protein